ncbi:hypothetical protein GYMLUDRAFT_245971 [Collybiopsis luxurians FD-317 M1]|uniref:G-protein coupled receptors family 2 profile 2 domain-containing protein n=1 Tax=Collybiopsis luxurians FD-317 M1 TaxID=944289 RepID=A0A0D0C7W7_9AGAR|nr:hypothetical protein GYMLUDRAFT_245971 [Collybiopsis luxurians FD-317 M1]
MLPLAIDDIDLEAARAFIALELSGGMGMLILVLSAWLSHTQILARINGTSTPNQTVNRSLMWFNFSVSWIISCFSFCLLFFEGKQFHMDEPPSFGLCLTQAALVYASSPLTGATTFTLLFDVWFTFHVATTNTSSSFCQRRGIRILLLWLPYALWICLLVGLLIVGGVKPEIVQRNLAFAPYCTLESSVIILLIVCLSLIFSLAVLVMLVMLVISLYRIGHQQPRSSPFRNQEQMIPFMIRLVIFALLGILALT